MSVRLVLSELTEEQFEFIEEKCVFKKEVGRHGEFEKIPLFEIVGDFVYVPIGTWKLFLPHFRQRKWNSVFFTYEKIPYTIETDPKNYRDQDKIIEKSLNILKEMNAIFLCLPCGFGKTAIGCFLSQHFSLRTVILCHSTTVSQQWKKEYNQFGDAKVEMVKKKQLNLDYDVHIMGILKASKMERKVFGNVGLVIIDEAHICSITAFKKTLLLFQPKYLIALSATPERADGLHRKFKHYFSGAMIKRIEKKPFVVNKYNTGISPTIKYVMYKGRQVPHWTTIINSLAYNKKRQEMIANIACKQTEKTMILSNRDEECTNVFEILYKKYCDDEISLRPYLFTKNAKSPPNDTGIIVGAMKKGGVGFDDPDLKVLIITTDAKDVRQFEGRLRTVNSTIYDFVDKYSTLENHWEKREQWYLRKGAEIKIKHPKRGFVKKDVSKKNNKQQSTNFLRVNNN